MWTGGWGQLVRACAHCLKPAGKHAWDGGDALLQQKIAESARGHAAVCPIAVRPARQAAS